LAGLIQRAVAENCNNDMKVASPSASVSGGFRSSRAEPFFHLCVANQTCVLADQTTSRKHREVRNPSHVESRRKSRLRFRVNLQHHGFAGHIFRRLRHSWCRGAARSAPFRPEIDEHRHRRSLNHLVEQRFIGRQGLRNRRQRRLAIPATSGLSQKLSWNSIFLPAISTSTDRRQNAPPLQRDFDARHQQKFQRSGKRLANVVVIHYRQIAIERRKSFHAAKFTATNG
jgi:hypothetical protein